MWIYDSTTGALAWGMAPAGEGYSGHGDGLNNPALQAVPDVGPIPRGLYKIGSFFTDPEKGPIVACLIPLADTNTYGRSGFMLHGDNPAMNHSASLGCVILPHDVRQQIAVSGDTDLQVI